MAYHARMEEFLKALGDRYRLHIINYLRDSKKNSNEIKEYIKKSQSATSQHLKTLVSADILEYNKEGTKKYYTIKHPELFEVLNGINEILQKIETDKVRRISTDSISDTLS